MNQKTVHQALRHIVESQKKSDTDSNTRQQPHQPPELLGLKQQFMQHANSYLTRCEGKRFEVYDRQLLNGLFLYFIGSPDSPYDLRKGLWIAGTVGSGKTTLMSVFREFLMARGKGFLLTTATAIGNDYTLTGCLDMYIHNANGYLRRPVTLCIDELGREQLPASHFGNRLNVMQYILHQRYALWQSQGVITHVTTNLMESAIETRYEDFILDRCRHMFNTVSLTGKSRRT